MINEYPLCLMKDMKRFAEVFSYVDIFAGNKLLFVLSIKSHYKIVPHLFVKIMQRRALRKIRMLEQSRVCNYVRKYSFIPRQEHNCTGMNFPFRLSCNYANFHSNLSARTCPSLLRRVSYNSYMSKSLMIILPAHMKIIYRMYIRIDARDVTFYQISEI